MLLLRVLVEVEPCRVPGAPHVDPHDHVAVGTHPRVPQVVPPSSPVALAVGQVLENCGKGFLRGKKNYELPIQQCLGAKLLKANGLARKRIVLWPKTDVII